jgi:hypothetical protein
VLHPYFNLEKMKKLFKLLFSLGISFLFLQQTYGQQTTTITANRSAGPALEWQGARYQYLASTNVYTQTNGWDIIPGFSDAAYGRYRFNHPTFKNSKIQQVTLTVTCRRTSAGSGPGIAYVTMPSCTDLWSSSNVSVNAQNLWSCLAGAAVLKSNGIDISIFTNNDGSSTTQTYLIHHNDPAFNANNANWDPNSNFIVLGLRPSQYSMEISAIKVNITYQPDPAIVNNSICCDQAFVISGSASLSPNATLGGGNGTYAYQWQSSPNNSTWTNISGAVSASYNTPIVTQTTYYRRVVTSGSASSNPSNSSKITIYPGISNNILCCAQSYNNISVPYTISGSLPTGGNNTYTYQWQSSLNNSSWTNIVNATNVNYTAPAVTQSTYFRRIVRSNNPLVFPDHSSPSIKITINEVVIGNSICCGQVLINSGDPQPLTQDPSVALSIPATAQIQWQSSTMGSFMLKRDIPGATNLSYDPPHTITTIYYRRKITTPAGVNYSNRIIVSVNNSQAPAIINNSICCSQTFYVSGDPFPITQSTAGISGGTGSFTYQWQSSTDFNNWQTITVNATGASYDPPFVTQTTYFRRIVTSGTYAPSYSVPVSVTIKPVGSCVNSVIQKNPLTPWREAAVSVVVGNKAYVGLGQDDNGYKNDFWEYNQDTDTWTQKTTFPGFGRLGLATFALNGKIYMGMGFANSAKYKDFYEYNPANDTWVRKADFPIVTSFGKGASIGNYGYVIFGAGIELWQYDPMDLTNGYDTNGNPKGAWIQKQSFPVVPGISEWYRDVLVIDNDLYACHTKATSSSSFINYFYKYNPFDLTNGVDIKGNPKGSWIRKTDIPSVNYSTIVLFAMGGKGYFTCPNDVTREYDPITDSYTTVPGNLEIWNSISFAINNLGYIGLGFDPEFSEEPEPITSFLQYSTADLVTGTVSTILNPNNTFNVYYTLSCGTYASPTIFTAQLSDANGSFASPINIGAVSSATSGYINVTIPAGTPNGTGYRIRVVSASPAQTGADNGTNISIQSSSNRIGSDDDEDDLSNTPTEVLVYPNPFTNEFTVQTNEEEIRSIEITDVNGVILYKQSNLTDSKIVLDVTSWSAGIYFLRIITNHNDLIIKKVVKIQ